MNRTLGMAWMGLLAVGGLTACLFLGCEDDGGARPGDQFSISPAQATVTVEAGAVVLRAVGGSAPFKWKVDDASMGTVTGSERTVTYTRTAKVGANVVRVTDSQSWTANATMLQPAEGAAAAALTLTANPASLTEDNQRSILTVQGGTPPYSWSVANTALGALQSGSSTAASRVYIRTRAGDNSVTVRDVDRSAANVIITQPSVALTVTATPASLAKNGDKSIVTVSGGTAPYTWSVQDVALGHLVSTAGSSVAYVRDRPGENVLTVSDSAGGSAIVLINQP